MVFVWYINNQKSSNTNSNNFMARSHSDLNDQNLFHSTIDTPPGVPGVSKYPDNQNEVHSGELER